MTIQDARPILELLAAYGSLFDRREVAAWLDLFDEPSVLAIDGREPLATAAARRGLIEGGPVGVHMGNHPLVEFVDDSTARGTQTFLFWNVPNAAARAGWYEDEYVCGDGRWRFRRRTIHFFETPAP